MKVLLVNSQFQLGGAETVVRQLHTGLRATGHDAELSVAFGKTYPAGVRPLYPRLLSRLHHSRLRTGLERIAPRSAWTDRAFRRLAGSDADVIHLHNFHGDYATLASLAHVAARKPFVWTFHALWGVTGGCEHPRECRRHLDRCGECPHLGEWPIGAVDRTAEQLAEKLALFAPLPLHVVAPSRYVAETIRSSRVGAGWRVHHIPNGVDPHAWGFTRKHDPDFRTALGLAPDAVIVLVVNRNFRDPQKGWSLAREALAALPPAHVQVVLVGQHSADAAAELPMRTVSLGYVSDRARLAELHEAADVFLFASPAENFPCAVIEAMAAECCVVATPSGGVVEQIEHERTGLLATSVSGEALADPLRRATTDASLRAQLGRAARETVAARFSERAMIEAHVQLYEAVQVG